MISFLTQFAIKSQILIRLYLVEENFVAMIHQMCVEVSRICDPFHFVSKDAHHCSAYLYMRVYHRMNLVVFSLL